DADHSEIDREIAVRGQVIESGHQLALGQIAGGPKGYHRKGIKDPPFAVACGGHEGSVPVVWSVRGTAGRTSMHPRLCPYVERGVKGQVSYVRRRRLTRGVSATSSWERSTMRRALYWDSMESPIGPIYVALTEAGDLALVMVGVSRMRFIEEIEKSGGQEAWDPKASA